MTHPDAPAPAWRTSRRSQLSNACVEVAFAGDRVLMRDSKNRPGPMITVTRARFAAFLTESTRSPHQVR